MLAVGMVQAFLSELVGHQGPSDAPALESRQARSCSRGFCLPCSWGRGTGHLLPLRPHPQPAGVCAAAAVALVRAELTATGPCSSDLSFLPFRSGLLIFITALKEHILMLGFLGLQTLSPGHVAFEGASCSHFLLTSFRWLPDSRARGAQP